MITATIFRSAFDDAKETKRFESPLKACEAFPDADLGNSLISVNGVLRDGGYLLQDGDICVIRLFPEGSGKDWLTGGAIGFGGAMSVLGFLSMTQLWNPVGWLAGAIMAGGAIAGALGFGIASAAGWSVADWLMGSAADMKSPAKLEQIPQLRGARNQSNYGKPVPIILGRHLLTPMYAGTPYSTISGQYGETQHFHALYMLGYGKLKVSNLCLGLTALASNRYGVTDGGIDFNGAPWLGNLDNPRDPDNPRIELRQTARECEFYPQAVVEEQLNIELAYLKGAEPMNALRFTAKNPMKVQIEITLPSGLVKYLDDGDEWYAELKISARWRIYRPDDADPWKEFGTFGTERAEYPVPGLPDLWTGIRRDGPVTVINEKRAKPMRFAAEHVFTSYSEVSDDCGTRVIELEIKRANEQSSSSKIADKAYLTAIRTWLFDNEESKKKGALVAQPPLIPRLRDRTARLALVIKASPNTQGYLDALNCIVEPFCRTWDPDARKWGDSDWDIGRQEFVSNTAQYGLTMEKPSSNPAAVALKLMQTPSLGIRGYEDSMLDLESFGEFYEWCEERKYFCNGVLTAAKRLDEVLSLVLSTGRASRVINGGKYGLLIDRPREYPVMVLNSQNVLEASNQKGFEDAPDGFLARYVNEDDGYQYAEEYVMAEGTGTLPSLDSLIETLELPFITNRAQAVKMAWYLLACRRLRPEIWSRKVSVDGYLISVGDMAEIQDDTISVGIGEGGVIQSVETTGGAITKLVTDGDFEVADMTKLYGLKIMQADGVNDIKIRTLQVDIPAPGLINDFAVSIPLSDAVVPHEGDIVAFGEYGKITTSAVCFGKKENGDGTFDLTFIPYQEGVYNTDTSKPIPEYRANITTAQRLPEPPSDTVTRGEAVEIAREFGGGEAATVYRLMPSAVIIRRYLDGVTTPDTVSCGQILITGSSPPTASDKTIKYKTNTTNGEVLYSGPLHVEDAWDYVNFYLYEGNVLLDFEEIPVLSEGSQAVFLDLNPDSETVIYNYDGTPAPEQLPLAIKATLYRGITEISNSVMSRNRLALYPGHGTEVFTPLATGLYPVSLSSGWKIAWSLEGAPGGVSIDDDGNITVAAGAALAARNAFAVVAIYEGVRYEKRLAIYAVCNGAPGRDGHDGEAAIFIDLSNEHISFTAKADGTLYEHPDITSQAMLFLGATELKEGVAWSIDPPVEGVSIDAEGLVTIAASYTQSADRVEVGVHAAYLGATHRALLTLYRGGRDGNHAVVYFLHPSVSQVKRNAAGVPDPATLSCKVFMIRGDSPPVEDTTKTVKYRTSATNTEYSLPHGTTINIPTAQGGGLTWIDFMLYGEGGVLLDGPERIGIVQDGQKGEKGDKGDTGSATNLPKYLGITETVTNSKTVVIKLKEGSTVKVDANTGDWVSFKGTSLGGSSPWKKNYCLQWNGSQWVQLDPLSSADTAHYMAALTDITDGAEEGVFSWIMAKKLMATDAFIKYLQVLDIELSELEENGKVQRGGIRSAGHEPGKSGFKIDYSGDAEFNGIIARGHIEADSGKIDSIVGTNLSIRGGSIEVGPLYISNELTAPSATRTYTSNYSVRTFVNAYLPANPELGKTITLAVPVHYGGKYGTWDLYGFTVRKEYRSTGTVNPNKMTYTVIFNHSGGTSNREAVEMLNNNTDQTIGYALVINGGGAGKTIRISGLPKYAPVESGGLWRDPVSNVLMVVP
jgi:hypothetical protein